MGGGREGGREGGWRVGGREGWMEEGREEERKEERQEEREKKRMKGISVHQLIKHMDKLQGSHGNCDNKKSEGMRLHRLRRPYTGVQRRLHDSTYSYVLCIQIVLRSTQHPRTCHQNSLVRSNFIIQFLRLKGMSSNKPLSSFLARSNILYKDLPEAMTAAGGPGCVPKNCDI